MLERIWKNFETVLSWILNSLANSSDWKKIKTCDITQKNSAVIVICLQAQWAITIFTWTVKVKGLKFKTAKNFDRDHSRLLDRYTFVKWTKTDKFFKLFNWFWFSCVFLISLNISCQDSIQSKKKTNDKTKRSTAEKL